LDVLIGAIDCNNAPCASTDYAAAATASRPRTFCPILILKAKAKTAYQDFLTLWKDTDPDIPILKQAKAEYARLQ
jgi:hypothetical protein